MRSPLALALLLSMTACSNREEDFIVAETDDSEATAVVEDTMEPETLAADTSADAAGDTEPQTDAPLDAQVDSESADSESADDAAPDVVVIDADAPLPCDSPLKCWIDKDGDGYALPGEPLLACACPLGTASRDPSTVIDCNDEDPSVHPGASTYHEMPYCVPGTACASKSFDYDCSGAEEPSSPMLFGGCGAKGSGCPGTGWSGAVPSCGASGTFVHCTASLLTCDSANAMATQLCR